jgi:plastocyanin
MCSMTDSRRLVLVLCTLAAVLVVLPAVASSETGAAIEAVNKPGGGLYGEETHAWSPTTATVSAGGTVTLSNRTAIEHGVHWVGGPETPGCSGIPVGTTSATRGANWSGNCTFTKPGTYTFYCTVHGPEMTGTITVTAAGTPAAPPAAPPTTPIEPSPASPSGQPLLGGSKGVKLASSQHGSSIHGSVAVAAAGAGGRLEVGVYATGASLAKTGHSTLLRVGHLVHTGVAVGNVSFAVKLDARARSALKRHRRLRLTLKITLAPFYGEPFTVTRTVVERI